MNNCRYFQFVAIALPLLILMGNTTAFGAAPRKLSATTATTIANQITSRLNTQPFTPALETEANNAIAQLTSAGFGKLANNVRGVLATKKTAATRVPGAPTGADLAARDRQIQDLQIQVQDLQAALKGAVADGEEIAKQLRVQLADSLFQMIGLRLALTGDNKTLADTLTQMQATLQREREQAAAELRNLNDLHRAEIEQSRNQGIRAAQHALLLDKQIETQENLLNNATNQLTDMTTQYNNLMQELAAIQTAAKGDTKQLMQQLEDERTTRTTQVQALRDEVAAKNKLLDEMADKVDEYNRNLQKASTIIGNQKSELTALKNETTKRRNEIARQEKLLADFKKSQADVAKIAIDRLDLQKAQFGLELAKQKKQAEEEMQTSVKTAIDTVTKERDAKIEQLTKKLEEETTRLTELNNSFNKERALLNKQLDLLRQGIIKPS